MNTETQDRCTEVLEDGTVYSFSIDKSNSEATKLLNKLFAKDGKNDVDAVCGTFSLFVDAIHILSTHGWTTTDLIREVATHSEADDPWCPDCLVPMVDDPDQ